MRSIKKTEWEKWKEVTEEKFENFEANSKGRMEEDYNRFSELLHEALDVVIPQKTIKIRENVKRPYWWNEEVKKAKQELDLHQKKYKQRNTVQNKSRLEEAELQFDKMKDKAQEDWTDKLLLSFESAGTSKERWEVYRKLTDKKTENTVLPLQ